MGNLSSALGLCFACMKPNNGNPQLTTITIQSTSACCRGEIKELKIPDEHLNEFKEIIELFLTKIQDQKEGKIDNTKVII